MHTPCTFILRERKDFWQQTTNFWNHHFFDTRQLLLVVGGVLCFFGIAKGTKNTSNNQELQTTG
jgi:hypothetical protein